MVEQSSSVDITTVTIIVGVFGGLVTVIQAMGLYILGDIRARITRLETHVMEKN
jgi:5-carboxymethyl-2-hydroxymuconate isomerase